MQIYQAIEERWPYFKKLGQTFPVSFNSQFGMWLILVQNSIRHNLSMNPAFVNIERPAHETGFCGGKGGYWRVSDDVSQYVCNLTDNPHR
jgi:hypothetical protein